MRINNGGGDIGDEWEVVNITYSADPADGDPTSNHTSKSSDFLSCNK